jgi:hypothetical protein
MLWASDRTAAAASCTMRSLPWCRSFLTTLRYADAFVFATLEPACDVIAE